MDSISILENLALHKPAYQLNPEPGLNVSQAGAAVDGLKDNTYIWGDQCVVSENGKTIALWRVDLTRISSIHHIVIYYVTGRRMWGMYFFTCAEITILSIFTWKNYPGYHF